MVCSSDECKSSMLSVGQHVFTGFNLVSCWLDNYRGGGVLLPLGDINYKSMANTCSQFGVLVRFLASWIIVWGWSTFSSLFLEAFLWLVLNIRSPKS